jgi:parvulin-like peptidyl-prolyl isomerase
VRAQHILVKPDGADEASRATARSRIEEIRQRLDEGADFAGEAAAHSDCPSGTSTGGSLGWVSRGMTVPDFETALFAMEAGELSDVVETPLGFHVIKKTAEDEGGEADLEDVHDQVRDFLRHARRGQAISDHVQELRQKALIEDD